MAKGGPQGGKKEDTPNYKDATDAKHLLDQIGQSVHAEVQSDAKTYTSELKGDLSSATFEGKPITVSVPCGLDYKYHTDVKNSAEKEYPCRNGTKERFPDKEGAECDKSKIKDGNDEGGACAPYRRLHLCDYNLENISDFDNINNHTLLVDVCLAALHEGQSITQDYPKYQATYGYSRSQICTMLARSFADIGDIVRGRDLYLRDKGGKTKLEKNLEKIFQKIQGKYPKLNDLPLDELREYWWEENRETVWKAITCNAGGSQYFRQTACSRYFQTGDKCRCAAGDVPTYFDYVPQYLRWFEEWAEDFCRKKNKKIKDVQKQCRGKYGDGGKDRYCSRNGYDCEKTKRAIGKLRYGKQCISCLYACNPYVEWIDNQRKQFDKQKKKYADEMQKYTNEASVSTTRRAARNENYDGYESKFYKIFKVHYSDVNNFLEKLSEEKACKDIKDTEGGKIDFKNVHGDAGGTAVSGARGKGASAGGDDSNKTFSHTEYCQPCPICGVKRKGNGWEKKTDSDQCNIKLYKPKKDEQGTKIEILKSGEGEKDIAEKLEAFCAEKNGGGGGGNSDCSLCEPWQCYHVKQLDKVGQDDDDDVNYVENGGGLCILKNKDSGKKSADEPEQFQKTFNDFFYYWVAHMLKDSIHWKKKLQRCLQNGKAIKCTDKCKGDCDCFLKWVKKKETEWKAIKDHFNTQEGFDKKGENGIPVGGGLGMTADVVLEGVLQKKELLKIIEGTYGNTEETEHIKKLLEEDETKSKAEEAEAGVTDSKKKNTIDWLIQHEEDDAEECLEIHEDEEEGGGNDECVEEGENFRYNPCSGTRHRAMVKNVAADMYRAARQQLTSRAGGRKALKADATKGKYIRGGTGNDLKNLCNITKKDSNDIRSINDGEPCTGKDGSKEGVRMKIGTEWSYIEENPSLYKDFYLPPRREHMCTSNLENLQTKCGPLKGDDGANVNNCFLGDVLLSANYEAKNIIDKYKEKNNLNDKNDPTNPKDHATICRAIRYSFADLGDIIRGRDLWDKDDGSKKMEGHLKKIFGKIKQELPKEIQEKYNDDPNYIKLRSDWWTANRRQVWKAMKCALKSDNIQCRMTPDDYIPQRLRWMTEWAEWFCKAQSQEYDKLFMQCAKCMGNGQGCTSGDSDCTPCSNQCNEYRKKIKEWHEQWDKMDMKYLTLYLEVLNTARNGGTHTYSGAVGEKDKPVVAFLQELQEANKSSTSKRPKRSTDGTNTDPTLTSPYSSAAGYIHQEIGYGGCQEQTQFCSGEKYAFKNTPKDHDEACDCGSKTPKGTVLREPCTIVHEILNGQDGTKEIDGCNKKSYNGWNCSTDQFQPGNDGVCMPPRRQKLCIHNLKELTKNSSKEELREAFIKCAAKETFFAWKKYKEDKEEEKKNEQLSSPKRYEELKQGTIPEEFKRIMYYTYGDYRDFLFGTDISRKNANSDLEKVKNNIDNVFRDNPQTNNTERQKWWKIYGKDIWEGMVCGLSHHIKEAEREKFNKSEAYQYGTLKDDIENFVSRPQFLRWFTEWADQFCRERGIKIKELEKGCDECIVSDSTSGDGKTCNNKDKCHKCKDQCQKYETWLTKWKGYYDKQSKKYFQDKNDKKFEYTSAKDEVSSSTHAYEYLQKALTKLCPDASCSCMDGESKETTEKTDNNSHNGRMPKSLDKVPEGYEIKCNCPETPPATTTQNDVNVCNIVKDILTGSGKLDDACTLKYGKTAPTGWKCIPSDTKSVATGGGSESAVHSRAKRDASADRAPSGKDTGSICIPPRRRRLYVTPLTKWAKSDETTEAGSQETSGGEKTPVSGGNTDALRDAFIQSAAIETFFLWDRYKKEWQQRNKPQNELVGALSDPEESPSEDDPDTQLKRGEIPNDFLRQMFYTLGDYRDILVGNSTHILEAVTIGSDNKTGKQVMQAIQDKIKQTLESGSTEGSVPPKSSDKNPQTWWNKHAESIWNGMICALTYEDDGEKGTQQITQDEEVKKALLENGTPKTQYEYEKVQLGEEEASGDTPTLNNPKLTQFVLRPTYFRYLEEWGETFCKERKKRLAQIYKDCRGVNASDNPKYCSGDGYDCNNELKHNNMFHGIDCPDCHIQCRKYRKWIDLKFEEYHNQKDKYQGEHKKLTNNSNGDKKFCEEIKKKATANKFLAALKHCKDGQNNNDQNNIIDFENPETTFGPLEYCKTCPFNGVTCSRGKSGTSGCKPKDEPENKENDKGVASTISILINDGSTNGATNGTTDGIDEELRNCSEKYNFFKRLRKQEWTCQKKSDEVHECNLNGAAESAKYVDSKYFENKISFKILFERWLRDFVEGYNKSKEIISRCTNDKNSCKQVRNAKCDFVGKWLDIKEGEWKNIKEYYEKYFNDKSELIPSRVKSFLEQGPFENDYKKAQEVVDNACDKEKLWGCTGANIKEGDENKCDNGNFISNLITKLTEKIGQCQSKHKETQTPCVESSTFKLTSTQSNEEPLDDDTPDEPLEEENPENKVAYPQICEGVLPKTKTVVEVEKCEPESTATPKEPAPTIPKKPASPAPSAEEPAPPAEPEPEPEEDPPPSSPPLSDQPTNSISDILSSTIPFGIAIALTSIVFLFLK
ncbi:hypothetical protein PFNF135_02037, partial [Plasmodium falciparum NF135/5.C10]